MRSILPDLDRPVKVRAGDARAVAAALACAIVVTADPDQPGYRVDPLTGDLVYVVATRQSRPNLPSRGCPFCPGGLEAPDAYDVHWFENRWPALPDQRCEIVLYTPKHEAAFWQLSPTEARRVVDLWADRTATLARRDDVDYVLVFENRGPEVGATIAHPHGQIYAFDHVPPGPRAELDRSDAGAFDSTAWDERLVATSGDWRAWVPFAANWPYELLVAPEARTPDLPSLDDEARDGLALVLLDVLARLDRLFDEPMPYMMWFHQRPTDGGDWPSAQLHLHIAPLHRRAGTQRFVAAGELGSHVYFNPVDPRDAAAQLREV
jgi:UDPglucose--hexose-1-phosphate uridylyltransferase